MAAIIVALDSVSEDRVLPALLDRGHRVEIRVGEHADPVSVLEGATAAVLLISAAPDRLTARVLEWCDGHGVRIVAVTASDRDVRHARVLKLLEVVSSDAPIDDFDALVRGRVIDRPVARTRERGSVLVVWGPAGAPGRTTVAITLAAELAAAGRSVVLIDADTHAASVAPALGLLDESPGFAAACRLAGKDGLSVAELERISQSYPIGAEPLRVLTGITRAYRWPELSAERVRRTLDACRAWVDYVVVDTGFSLENDEEISTDLFAPRRNAATLTCIDAADEVIAVGAADPIGLQRYLRAHGDLLERAIGIPVTTVINKVRSGSVGLNPSGQVRATLQRFGGIDDPVLIPHDEKGTDAALLAGRALRDASPRSSALAALRRFTTSRILPPPEEPVTRRSRRGARARQRIGRVSQA
ncbi:AAA family ATPase [Mycetocola zhujimingii]|nr:regulator [Mycetocola zhujimingii]